MARVPAVNKQWIAVGEAANVIGVSRGYVRLLVDTGQLRARRTTFGIRLIDRMSVKNFARKRLRRRRGQDRTSASGVVGVEMGGRHS
jgi:excisionase family DNA binding protein